MSDEAAVSPDRSSPLGHIARMSINYQSGHATILGTDGRSLKAPVHVPEDPGLVEGSSFIPSESRMEIQAAGETFSLQIGTLKQSASSPVIYLDQNHWIDFARWQKHPTALSSDKRPLFELLDAAVREQKAIVPLASAHFTETGRRAGRSRLDLAATMLRISRGWQMRSALALRRAELRELFNPSLALARDDVITLDPEAILNKKAGGALGAEFGPALAGLLQRQVWATTVVSMLMDPNRDDDVGREGVTQWAHSFTPLAQHMRGNALAKRHARDLTRVRFISDLSKDLAAAVSESGRSPEEFSAWLKHDAESALSASPGLGRLREVLHLRIMNSDEKWEANDLNDWFYLSYAAAYCDLVVGERKMINYLRRVDARVSAGAVLHFRAGEALADLEQLLAVATTSEAP